MNDTDNTGFNFSYNDIRHSFIYCFLDYPKAGQCVRHIAASVIPQGKQWGNAVYPTAGQGEACTMYKPYRVIKGAYGFGTLFQPVKAADIVDLRQAVKDYLGGNGTYYRYNRGELLLTPEQQQGVLDIFKRFGYDTVQEFEGYKNIVDF